MANIKKMVAETKKSKPSDKDHEMDKKVIAERKVRHDKKMN